MFDLIIANPPYGNSFYKRVIDALIPHTKQLAILCPWDLVTAANKGKATREALDNHVIDYKQTDAAIFGSPLKLICGAFDLTKETGKYLKPFDPNSIDAKIIEKFSKHPIQLKEHVYWSEGITGGQTNDPEKCKKFIENSCGHKVLRAISATRFPKRLVTEKDEYLGISMWGIKDEESLDLLEKSSKSQDWIDVVFYVIKLIGDARDFYRKEVSYVPLFTSFEELKLTEEEIERVKSI